MTLEQQDDVKQAICRLAHFNPTCQDEYGNQVLDYLVLDSLAALGGLKATAVDVKRHLKGTFHLDFEEPEINASGKRLGGRNLIIYKEGERFERPRLEILPETEHTITGNCLEVQNRENEVLEEWKMELSERYKGNRSVIDKIDCIVDNLHVFTSKMLKKHGTESVALLYPEDNKAQAWLTESEKIILEELPSIDSFTDAIVRLEIPRFFKNPDNQRRDYISSLFNSSFFWHLIQVDEKCSKLLRKVITGQRLYLDNNILYSLVGFHGADMLQSVHSMLKFAGELGYDLWVTTKTVDEFQESLRWQKKELKQKPTLPAELARIAIDNLEEDSFVTSYWKELAKNRTTIDEFIADRSHIESILDGLDIEKTNKHRKDIEESQELLDEESVLQTVVKGEIHESVLEHDAFHRIFINKVRKGPKFNFGDAIAWFLTHDSKLPVYGRVARRGKGYLPFCITTDQWVQINRPLLARTSNEKEYEESFHVLVTQPFLRTITSSFSLEKAYNEVLGRLNRYQSMNPELALKVATDTHFMVSMALETDEAEKQEKIESKVVDVAATYLSQIKTLEKQIDVERNRGKELEHKFGDLEKNYELQEKEIQIVKDNLETTAENKSVVASKAEELEGLVKTLKSEKKNLETQFGKSQEDLQTRFREYKTSIKKWGIFIAAAVILSFVWWRHDIFLSWPSLLAHPNRILISVAGELAILSLLLCYPANKHWKQWLPLAGLFVATIFGLAAF